MARKKKPANVTVQIAAYAAEGKCVAHLDNGKILFVEKAVPGDVAEVRIRKQKKSFAEGIAVNIITPSPERVTPFCEHFGVCGGCKWQMLPYEKQLQYKQQQVKDQLTRIGQLTLPEMQPIAGSVATEFYRNKLEFTFSAQRYLTADELRLQEGQIIEPEKALGFHAPGLFDKVVPIRQCYLQPEPSNKILALLRNLTADEESQYYDFKKQEGWLRNVIIRVATTGEVLVNIIFKYDRPEQRRYILEQLLTQIPEISSLHYTINPKLNDTIYDLAVNHVYGTSYITETLENYRFKISPKSFFQTNTRQAEVLYQHTREMANLQGHETVYDLYCGTGSIGLFCAQKAGKIIGVETVADAIADAKINAEINSITNTHFFCGDAAKLVNEEFVKTHGKADVVITDPPRAGMHETLINQILFMNPERVVYVSCNPATQARDIALMDKFYEVVRIQPVDMFPHTHHIENIILLQRRNK